jgi:hypothetical protein
MRDEWVMGNDGMVLGVFIWEGFEEIRGIYQ